MSTLKNETYAPLLVVESRGEISVPGRRSENQDRIRRFATQDGEILLLADGLGGQLGGGTAAEIAVGHFPIHFRNLEGSVPLSDAIAQAAEAVNREIYGQGVSENTALAHMASTIVVVALQLENVTPQLLAANAGDSRAYLFRGGAVLQLTHDHTVARELAARGLVEGLAADDHPQANMLTRAMGAAAGVSLEFAEPLALRPGDGVLLSSDGLSRFVAADEIARILSETRDAQAAAQRLVETALERGSDDNISIQYVRLAESLKGIHAGARIGQHVLERRLGIGGMSQVWLGRHIVDRTPVAVKILQPMFSQMEAERLRFQREGQRQAALTHPSIVRVHGYEEADVAGERIAYLILDYIDGGSLQDLLDQRAGQPFSEEELLRLIAPVLDALAAAHSEDLVHRDVKPANILLDRAGQSYLGDFGLVLPLRAKRLTQTGSIQGTWQYMSPEQLRAESALDARSDIYSVGCVLYEMAAGHRVFSEESDGLALMMAHLRKSPEPITGIRPEVQSVIVRALEKDKRDRWQSCAEFRTALVNALQGIQPPRPKWSVRRFANRHRRALAAAGAALVLAAAVAGAAQIRERERGRERQIAETGRQALTRVQADNATRQETAIARLLARFSDDEAREHNLTGAALLALESLRHRETKEGNEALQQSLIWLGMPGKQLAGHMARVTSLTWSPDGKRLASISRDGTIRIWSWPAGAVLKTLDIKAIPDSGRDEKVAWSPDGRWLAATDRKSVTIWTAANWQLAQILKGHEDNINSISWKPDDSRMLATASDDRTVRVWDVTTATAIQTYQVGEKDHATCVSWGNPKSALLTGFTALGMQWNWNITDFKTTAPIQPAQNILDAAVDACAWASDGNQYAVVGTRATSGIQLITGVFDQNAARWLLSTVAAGSLSWNADKMRLASGSSDRVLVWPTDPAPRPHNFAPLETFEIDSTGDPRTAVPIAWSPDGSFLAYGFGDRMIRVSAADSNPLVRNILGQEPYPWHAFWRKNATQILTIANGGKAMVWDASTGKRIESIDTPIPGAYSPETDRLASVTSDLKVGSILDLATTTRHNWRLPEPRVPYAWNHQGNRIFWRLSGRNRILGSQIRDAASDRLQVSLPPAVIAAWAPDGDRVAIVQGTLTTYSVELSRKIEIRDSHNGKVLQTLDAGSDGGCIAWSLDGTRIASGSDRSVEVWDAGSGRSLWRSDRSQNSSAIAFSADGRKLASGDFATLNIWDAATGQSLETLDVSHGSIQALAWSPGGERLAVGSTDGTLKILAMDPQVIRNAACQILYRNLTRDEWGRNFQYFEDLVGKIPYRETCATESQPAAFNR